MAGYAQIQTLKVKLKPFRKHPGHYMKSPDMLQENVAACQAYMAGKPPTELSTINTKVLSHWAECLYALGRKFGEKKLLPLSCDKYELIANHTMGEKDYNIYCKWGIAECEKSLHSIFFKDGKSKKALYKRGEEIFKNALNLAGKNSIKRSTVLYAWGLSLFRYARSCESMCSSKEVFRMYQKAGKMFYESYTVNPSNKQAVYKWGKLLDSQALIISHRNDPELALADDVDNFLIVYSSLAMRGKLKNLKALIALCLSPEEVTQNQAIDLLAHLSSFQAYQVPQAPKTPPTPPRTPPPISPLHSAPTSPQLSATPLNSSNTPNAATNPFESDTKAVEKNSNPFEKGTNPFEDSSSPHVPAPSNNATKISDMTENNPFEERSELKRSVNGNPFENEIIKEDTNPFDISTSSASASTNPNTNSPPLSTLTVSSSSPKSVRPSIPPLTLSVVPVPITLDLSLSSSGLISQIASPTDEETRVNQRTIAEEAKSTLAWIREIIKQNKTLTITVKIQSLKSLGEEGQRVWRLSKISYQDALDNFEIFANCLNFHTKRQLAHLQKYLTVVDNPTTRERSDSTPDASSDLGEVPPLEGENKGEQADGPAGLAPPAATRNRSRSFNKTKTDYEQLFIYEDINKFYTGMNKIGRGGFGDVFTARSKLNGKTVAVKTMRRNFDEYYKQIGREISIMKSCIHPNMVNYIESYLCHDQVWIVMEYCDGGSLRHFAASALLEEPHISYISSQILHGLVYLHTQHRIHRDIKADNVLLNMDGTIKLADLGIAADLDDPDTPNELMSLCGSKFWMAPEMIKFQPYNYKVDIWSFGCLLIELAEGKHPYEGCHSMAAMFKTATQGGDKLSNPNKWSGTFKDFLAQCLQMNPAARPSAEDLLKHPFIATYDTPEHLKSIKEAITQRLEHVFVGYQLEKILF